MRSAADTARPSPQCCPALTASPITVGWWLSIASSPWTVRPGLSISSNDFLFGRAWSNIRSLHSMRTHLRLLGSNAVFDIKLDASLDLVCHLGSFAVFRFEKSTRGSFCFSQAERGRRLIADARLASVLQGARRLMGSDVHATLLLTARSRQQTAGTALSRLPAEVRATCAHCSITEVCARP
jgi:hypothetical protein